MKNSSCYPVLSNSCYVQLALLVFLLTFAFNVSASHGLTLSPPQPSNNDHIVILVTGDWPLGGAPALTGWYRNEQSIRIDAFGILPGIEQPIAPYQFNVDIGRLSPGQYHVDYFIDVLAAPGPAPGGRAALPLPVASIDFEVFAAPLATPLAIPALSSSAVVLLSALLVLISIVAHGGHLRTNQPKR